MDLLHHIITRLCRSHPTRALLNRARITPLAECAGDLQVLCVSLHVQPPQDLRRAP